MSAVAERTGPEDQVRELLDSYFEAVQASDIERIVPHYTPDIVAYDAISRLEFVGIEAYKAHWEACMGMCDNFIFEPRPPVVAASGDVAFAHTLIRCGGAGADGTVQTGWMRATFGARRTENGWRIVHEHHSAPFEPMTGKMLTDLEP